MIYRNGKLILEVLLDIINLIDQEEKRIHKHIGAIYKGSLLVWLTIYNAIKSCFGSGTWYSDKNWLSTDNWKNN